MKSRLLHRLFYLKLIALNILVLTGSFTNLPNKALYRSPEFSVFTNRVEQGSYMAKAIGKHKLVSNYQSPANSRYSRAIEFKFSINGKDNELPFGVNHRLVLLPQAGKVMSPVIEFGKVLLPDTVLPQSNPYLEANTKLTLRLDMQEVMKSFETQGFYTGFNGDKIAKTDFRGVYVAGGSAPLGWDFENLPSRPQFQLTDEDGDGIYQITLTMNEYEPDRFTAKEWQLKQDLSGLPTYTCGIPLIETLYNLSLEEMLLNIRPDGAFMAGEKWDGVWTRDISYSILLSLAMLQPEISQKSLMAKVSNERIIQDTGTGGSWPVSSDRVSWAIAAWEVYLTTGDKDWLLKAYRITKNTADDDQKSLTDMQTGLMMGESSFLDWRKQTYPRWMNPVDIYRSQNLGTNALFARTFQILSWMEKELGLPDSGYAHLAKHISNSINHYLWSDELQYYGQYLYGSDFPVLSPRSETLGESLCVLFDIADNKRASAVISHTPALPFGTPCIFPQIPNIPPYHNNGIWPFVQAYFTWAAAKTKNRAAVEHGLASIYRQSALFVTNKENMTADTGDFNGTEINSDRQLWSVAGHLATVYRVFYGMNFTPDGLIFTPFVPKAYKGNQKITGLKYRNALLTIELKGYGSYIRKFSINGQVSDTPFVPADAKGPQHIVIELDNRADVEQPFQIIQNRFTPETPEVVVHNRELRWEAVPGAKHYLIYQNGRQQGFTKETVYSFEPGNNLTQYQVCAVGQNGDISFLSEPVTFYHPDAVQRIEAETMTQAESLNTTGHSGQGVIELSKTKNTRLGFDITAPVEGQYRISFGYSNGCGPINTDNKCAIRTLSIPKYLPNGRTVVFPQSGFEEWSNWGMSNAITVWLPAGVHHAVLSLEPHNRNMNGLINTCYLDFVEVVRR